MRTITTVVFILVLAGALAQEMKTVETKYPGTEQKWIKNYLGEINKGNLKSEVIYHDNGQEWMAVDYDRSINKETWNWYYPDGKRLWSATIIDGKLDGRYQHWHENGNIAEIIMFTANVEEGDAVFYYEDGQLAMEGSYEAGIMKKFTFYDEDGALFNGDWTWNFFPIKDLRMKGYVVDGKMQGTWEYSQTANYGRANRVTYSLNYEDGTIQSSISESNQE